MPPALLGTSAHKGEGLTVKQAPRIGTHRAISLVLLPATFNPCGLPALPGFITFLGGGEQASAGRRLGLSTSVSFGAMSLVVALGIIVAIVGAGTKDLVAPNFRWVQLGVGLFLVTLAALHLTGRTESLPVLGPVMGLGSRVWEGAVSRPTPQGSFLFGAGFVLVGVG